MINQRFITLLSQARDKGYGVPALTYKLGRPYSTVQKWLHGHATPARRVIIDVCHRLGADPKEVLGAAAVDRLKCPILNLQFLQSDYARQYRDNSKEMFEIVNACAAAAYTTVTKVMGGGAVLFISAGNVALIQPSKSGKPSRRAIRIRGDKSCVLVEVVSCEADGAGGESGTVHESNPLNDFTLENAIKLIL